MEESFGLRDHDGYDYDADDNQHNHHHAEHFLHRWNTTFLAFLWYSFPFSKLTSPRYTWSCAPSIAVSIVSNFSPCRCTSSASSYIIPRHSRMLYFSKIVPSPVASHRCICLLYPRQSSPTAQRDHPAVSPLASPVLFQDATPSLQVLSAKFLHPGWDRPVAVWCA